MRSAAALVCVVALSVCGASAWADAGSPPATVLLPVDESHLDASFNVFRTELLAAIDRKDVDHLLRILAPDIKLSFGGSYGIEDFRDMWLAPEEAGDGGDIWAELGTVLRLGCVREESGENAAFIAPYVSARFPDGYDAFEYEVLVEPDVALRAGPNDEAEILDWLSYAVVRVIDDGSNQVTGWAHVAVPEGQEGYVLARSVRSPIDYRAFFQKIDGAWKMTIFIAGD